MTCSAHRFAPRLALMLLVLVGMVRAGGVVAPFEQSAEFAAANPIDEILSAAWKAKGIEPAHLCSDEVFLRRVYLDLIGTLPSIDEVQAFRADRTPGKRAAVVEALFGRKEFADYWSLKWCDVLRVKAEFPINLWPNAVQAYHRWVRESLRSNQPYNEFARALLTSSGSNFREAPVNFYRAMQGHDKGTIAQAVALTFMGSRVDAWPQAQREGFEALFSRVLFKGTAEWKEEIVMLDPAPTDPLRAVFPDGQEVTIPAGTDPRRVFADWLIRGENPWFAHAAVNRQWFWLFGRGIVEEADDLRPDNPPASPDLLDYLAKELVDSHYDSRHIFRLIVNSRTYQQSAIPQSDKPEVTALFACYPVRRLDAEVLVDALTRIFGPGEDYSSAIPEPFTFIPGSHRTVTLADGSITSQFLEMFGRPARDTGLLAERNNLPTDSQRLHLLNSSHVQNKIEKGWGLKSIAVAADKTPAGMVRALYDCILSRAPTPAELLALHEYTGRQGVAKGHVLNDAAWALVNTKEFLYRH